MEESNDDSRSGQTKATSIMALKNKFDNKPETTVKPSNFKQYGGAAKYGGGGNLNVFAAGPGDLKPAVASKKPTDKTSPNSATPNSAIPNGTPERSTKLNIPSAFRGDSSAEKPQLAAKPFRKQSESDSNNNSNTADSPEMAKAAYGVKGIGGKFEPNKPAGSVANVSPRKGSVGAIAGELFKEKSPFDLKTNLRKVSDSKFNFESKSADKADTNGPKQIDFRKNLHHAVDSKPSEGTKKPWQRPVPLTRKSDGKKFKKVEKFSVVKPTGKGPEKPEKLDVEIDFELLALDFKNCLDALESGQPIVGEEEEQEDYDDVAVLIRSPPQRQPSVRAVSLIPTMTDEEEAEWNQAGFPGLNTTADDLPPPPDFIQEDYDDVAIRPCVQEEEPEELYEPLPDELDLPYMPGEEPPPPTGPKPAPPPVTQLHKKDEDGENEGTSGESETPAEKKKREKAEKEAKAKKEKELKKKEKELAKLLKDYKITAEQLAMSVTKGRVKTTQKGSHKLDVSVTEGDRVDIIRMIDNVKGRWLIRLDNTGKDRQDDKGKPYSPLDLIGYVDSNNIEVDTDIIKASMKENVGPSKGKPDVPEPIAQEMYEDVDGENPANAAFEEEEIYEECN